MKNHLFISVITILCFKTVVGQNIIEEKEINFFNDSLKLSGTILTPVSDTLIPAIVFLHGSGEMDRSFFRPLALEFAKLGIASFFYDKRGTGLSSGIWESASMEDLADDAIAAIDVLKQHPSVDPQRIGLWGISQGGWIAPIAAKKSKEISFLIINSGGGASPVASDYYSFENIINHQNLNSLDKRRAYQLVDLYFSYLKTGDGRGELVTELANIQKTSNSLNFLSKYIILPTQYNSKRWREFATYDPTTDIENIKIPILLLFGDIDLDHPTGLAIEKWTEASEKAGNERVTTIVFPGAGHGIRLGRGHNQNAPLANGYWAMQMGWLINNILNSNEKK